MLDYIANNWLDLLLTLVGLSAFAVYYIEKYDKKRTAATLVINQIDEIDEQLSALKHEPQLNGQVIYNAKTVIDQNVWEQYKHLFAKTLDKSEYELIQKFFDNAERVERVRLELVDMIVTAWHDKSAVTHETISNMIIKHKDNPATMEAEINTYRTYL